jgi:endonuclease/exonuclease/phosphatase family metal-dependent hydrolase
LTVFSELDQVISREDQMRLASYNVENLFERARVMNLDTWRDGADVLQMHAEMNGILGKKLYSAADKKKIIELLKKLGLDKKDDGEFVILRQNRGHLIKRGKNGLEVVADGRGDWIGWLDLTYAAVDEIATRMTARVMNDVNADVLGVVEAENRPSLLRFCKDVMPSVGAKPYDHVMLIDGNDERGIDVAIMMRAEYDLIRIRSHVDDTDQTGLIFSRDCAEYTVKTPLGNDLILLVNHLKSKGFGSQTGSNAKRKRQTERVKAIYQALRRDGVSYVAVIGDFNDTPNSDPITPLTEQTDLKDISAHNKFDDGGRPGTFGNCTQSKQIDYILMSPELFAKAQRGGIFRKGTWGGKNGDLWEHYPEMQKAANAASDHAAIWADIDL